MSNQFDPHSRYLSPRSAEDFDVNMSLKLNGIGALLGIEDDYTKIISLVPGGPAEKSGKIKPEDRISKIKQGDEDEFIDVVGWRIDEVVDLIRGEIDTELQIEFISFDSDIDNRKIVTLKREEVKLEEVDLGYTDPNKKNTETKVLPKEEPKKESNLNEISGSSLIVTGGKRVSFMAAWMA